MEHGDKVYAADDTASLLFSSSFAEADVLKPLLFLSSVTCS